MKQTGLIKRLSNHPLILLLKNNQGNPKALILMEPLWGIPFNLIAPFAILYMYNQGITDVQIGLILSIAMVIQVFFSFAGGIITDKLGRKVSTMIGDFFGWSFACLIWAISNNFWLFLTAALFNGFEQINQTSWFCLLIEDADERDMLGIYTWVSIGGLVAVFFAPITGLLIHGFTLVPVIRILYVIFSINMLIKVIITYRCCRETHTGQKRKAESKDISVKQMVDDYKVLIPKVLKDKEIMKIVWVGIILYIANLVNINFFGLYITQRLGIADRYLAFFPILNAAVMLIFMVALQHRLEAVRFQIPMWGGLILFAFSHFFLILMPIENIPLVMIYVFALAVSNALVIPRRDALLQIMIDRKERARINALIVSFTIALASPFGYLAGILSSVDRRLPFVFTLFLYIIAIFIVGSMRNTELHTNSPMKID